VRLKSGVPAKGFAVDRSWAEQEAASVVAIALCWPVVCHAIAMVHGGYTATGSLAVGELRILERKVDVGQRWQTAPVQYSFDAD